MACTDGAALGDAAALVAPILAAVHAHEGAVNGQESTVAHAAGGVKTRTPQGAEEPYAGGGLWSLVVEELRGDVTPELADEQLGRTRARGIFFLPAEARQQASPETRRASSASASVTRAEASADADSRFDAAEPDRCAPSRQLLMPDWRQGAAGDLSSHISHRERARRSSAAGALDAGGLEAPDGSLFVHAPAARSVVYHRDGRCTLEDGQRTRALAFHVQLEG